MAKRWEDLQIGDMVIACSDGLRVTEGNIYTVTYVYGNGIIEFSDDERAMHNATEDWVLMPYEGEEGGDKMPHQYEVGDFVEALEYDLDIRKGSRYEIVSVREDSVLVLDDVGARTRLRLDCVRPAAEESAPSLPSDVLTVVDKVKRFKAEDVYAGQVRTAADGMVALVIEGRNNDEDRPFNAVILKDFDEVVEPITYRLNWHNDATKEDILSEFPIAVKKASITIE